ncbi:MAG: TIM barrel protein [Chloroflexi bacterium]|nr:TIM barrel protein [Chloroflexota bacterium]
MAKLLFGTGGTPRSSKSTSSADGIRRIRELGLGCMELEFVQGVKMGEKTALQVREVAEENGVRLSAHAPYFLNLNAKDPEKINASRERLLQTARICHLCGAKEIVFHAAYYMGDHPSKVYDMVKRQMQEVLGQIEKENLSIRLRPEVTGEVTQFGTLEEVLNLCSELKELAPCVDFAHWHARNQGAYNTYDEFISILGNIERALGRAGLDEIHIHLSGIGWGKHGETKHYALKEADMNYKDLLRALKERGAGGMVVCESPILEEDALLLQETYRAL